MRERTELLVLTLLECLSAELGLVLLDVVQTFHLVVSVAAILVVAVFQRAKVKTVIHLSTTTTSVELPVVLCTLLWVMGLLVRALLHLKHFEI